MGTEIERKFLVQSDVWKTSKSTLFRQGYLTTDPKRTVRVRMANNKGYLTVKGLNRGAVRQEYEYSITVQDAREMLDQLCHHPLIEKRRYRVEHAGCNWEIDEFLGTNLGLVLAELELDYEDQPFDRPPWLGEEVTYDDRYFNSFLVKNPYTEW